MSVDFKWAVEFKDDRTGTMVVSYTLADGSNMHRYNIPQPPAGSNVDDHITLYAPLTAWVATSASFEPIETGSVGAGTIHPVSDEDSESPNITGNWGEEYLRAMIYQVLEEIKEAQV